MAPGPGYEEDFWVSSTRPEEEPQEPDLLTRAARALLWIAAVVAGIYVSNVFWDGLETQGYDGDASGRWFPFVGLVVLAAAVLLLLRSYRSPHRRADLMVPASLIGFFLLFTGMTIYNSRDNGEQLVRDYCSYGAASTAQWIGCVEHVTPGQIVFSDTPAADFANGEQDECGSGAGPFCKEAMQEREYRRVLDELEREASP